jgi:D-threo-aldose 1-dehydrogenase
MLLGHALAGRPRDSFVLATKVGFLLKPRGLEKIESFFDENPAPFRPVSDGSYGAVVRSFKESLNRLEFERADIPNLHDPDECYEQVVREACPALLRL